MKSTVILLSLFFFLLSFQVQKTIETNLIFELWVDEEKCFFEDLPHDTVVLGHYTLAPSFSTITSIQVWDSEENEVWKTDDALNGTFAFTTEHSGEISICFYDRFKPGMTGPPSKRQVTFGLKSGHEAKDYSSIAKKDDLRPLELEMIKLEDLVLELNADFRYLKSREGDMHSTNESTHQRVLWLSIFSLTTLVSLGIFEIYYLKRYFQQKKLI